MFALSVFAFASLCAITSFAIALVAFVLFTGLLAFVVAFAFRAVVAHCRCSESHECYEHEILEFHQSPP